MKSKKGFTLIELIVVIAIIVILIMIIIPLVSGYINTAKTAVANANARQCYDIAVIKQADNQYDILSEEPEIYNGCIVFNDNNRYRFEDLYGGVRGIVEVYWFEDTSQFTVRNGRITNFNSVASNTDSYGIYTP